MKEQLITQLKLLIDELEKSEDTVSFKWDTSVQRKKIAAFFNTPYGRELMSGRMQKEVVVSTETMIHFVTMRPAEEVHEEELAIITEGTNDSPDSPL